MKLTDDIRNLLGIADPNKLLDPDVYPQNELEEDLIEIDWEMQDVRDEIQQLSQEYDQKIEEIAAAPEWEEEFLLQEADERENRRKDKVALYGDRHDLKMLLKGIESTRERLNTSGESLNIHNRLQQTDRTEVKRVLKQELRKKGLDDKKVEQITDAMSDARDRELKKSGSNDRDLEKHRKRAEKAASTPADERGGYLDEADQNDDTERRRDRARNGRRRPE